MMKKRSLALMVTAVLALSLLTVAAIYAATAPAEIKMASPYEHKKSISVFTHQKHSVDYKIACGECHHDDKGQPLTKLKDGDTVQKCFECHKKPGELKGKEAKGMSDKDLRAYHANAVHDNCVGCHKKFNKENKDKGKTAPQKCEECHPKN
ncbi:MAG: cytochrome c3 family protein [Desulfatitalea sp.]